MDLKHVRIKDETSLGHEFRLETSGRNSFCHTLLVKFTGEYRDGSEGKPDLRFMVGMTMMAVAIWHPAAVVVDLSELRYEWGDDMRELLSPTILHRKAAIVVGPKCAPAIATLLWGIGTQRTAIEADFIFDNIEAAWQAVKHRD